MYDLTAQIQQQLHLQMAPGCAQPQSGAMGIGSGYAPLSTPMGSMGVGPPMGTPLGGGVGMINGLGGGGDAGGHYGAAQGQMGGMGGGGRWWQRLHSSQVVQKRM